MLRAIKRITMEKLKAMVPDHLIDMIGDSGTDDLPSTCSALLNYLHPLEHFRQLAKQLSDPAATTCGKDPAAASQWKLEGNAAFAKGDYPQSLKCYTKALQSMPLSLEKIDKIMVAALHLNRASTIYKMGMLKESIRDCSRAIKLHPSYSKAWYRRGQVHGNLKNYEDAIKDMHMALAFENSSMGKAQVRIQLENIMEQSQNARKALTCHHTDVINDFDCGDYEVDLPEIAQFSSVLIADRGWENQAENNILPGHLVLHEEPYVAIVLKHCRDTHCHFCFKELPGDSVPCGFCAVPLFCSENCRDHAAGNPSGTKYSKNRPLSEKMLDDSYCETETLSLFENDSCQTSPAELKDVNWFEHKHECGGMSWAAVLPTEVTLAARMLIKSIYRQSFGKYHDHSTHMLPNLCHHYEKMQTRDKLELHIFSIVLAFCLQSSTPEMFQLTGTFISKLVLLIAQVRVNAMAIMHVSSPESVGKPAVSRTVPTIAETITRSVQEVQVAQAVYVRGSLFNHSCDPNIHASFISRRLFVHAIKPLPPGSPLELCYGPQVGESRLEDRQRWLEERYFFSCKCRACSELNLSDLCLSSFRCAKHDCQGVILDKAVVRLEKLVGTNFVSYVNIFTRDLALPVDEQLRQSINNVAPLLISTENDSMTYVSPGQCLRCGSMSDLERMQKVANQSLGFLKRVQGEICLTSSTGNEKQRLLDEALQFLQSLRSVLHAFNKDIAKAEDIIAEMFCLTLQPESAIHHCKVSIQILEKLYHSDHIVIANELVKLVSIELSLNKYACAKKNLARIDHIFSRHYGCNYVKMFPYLITLQR